ncbi:MAG: NYN domain-containing protein [Burkholderiales bacterium]|nr:NYN domain-containing protein [Burkholderiales bacterium]
MSAQAALLLDADNLSSASDVDEAFRHLAGLGLAVSVRRAYGGHDKLTGIKDVLRAHAMRSFINQGKGTTDVALVVDAMDLLHGGSLPSTVAIASSDADFAPLALRLREAGMRVLCFARREKADDDALALAYDEVVYVDVAARRPAARKSPAPARTPAPAPAPAAKAAPAARKVPARKAVLPAGPDAQPLLQAVPGLRTGKPMPMNDVVKQLRDAKLLSKHGKLATLLRPFAGEFQLMPEASPTQVQWMGRRTS